MAPACPGGPPRASQTIAHDMPRHSECRSASSYQAFALALGPPAWDDEQAPRRWPAPALQRRSERSAHTLALRRPRDGLSQRVRGPVRASPPPSGPGPCAGARLAGRIVIGVLRRSQGSRWREAVGLGGCRPGRRADRETLSWLSCPAGRMVPRAEVCLSSSLEGAGVGQADGRECGVGGQGGGAEHADGVVGGAADDLEGAGGERR